MFKEADMTKFTTCSVDHVNSGFTYNEQMACPHVNVPSHESGDLFIIYKGFENAIEQFNV